MNFGVYQQTIKLRHEVGVKVQYFQRGYHHGNLFKEVSEIVKTARESIYIVNSFTPVLIEKEAVETIQERAKYYKTLIEQVRGNRNLKYERLLQLSEGQSVKNMAADKEFIEHLHEMLQEKNASSDRIRLLKVEAKRQINFVLIDGKYLILENNEITDEKKVRMHGIFVIEDSQGRITDHFERIFSNIKNDYNKGALSIYDLPRLVKHIESHPSATIAVEQVLDVVPNW